MQVELELAESLREKGAGAVDAAESTDVGAADGAAEEGYLEVKVSGPDAYRAFYEDLLRTVRRTLAIDEGREAALLSMLDFPADPTPYTEVLAARPAVQLPPPAAPPAAPQGEGGPSAGQDVGEGGPTRGHAGGAESASPRPGGSEGTEEPAAMSLETAVMMEREAAEPDLETAGAGWALCWLVLAASVSTRRYDARARGLVRRMAALLDVPWRWMVAAEAALSAEMVRVVLARAERLHLLAAPGGGAGAGSGAEGKKGKMGYMRAAKIGGAAVLGGAIIGLTGGLAAPAVIAGGPLPRLPPRPPPREPPTSPMRHPQGSA